VVIAVINALAHLITGRPRLFAEQEEDADRGAGNANAGGPEEARTILARACGNGPNFPL
jgi:hypothetical protein